MKRELWRRPSETIPSLKLTWKPIKGPESRIVVLKGAPLHFHVSVEDCRSDRFPETTPMLAAIRHQKSYVELENLNTPELPNAGEFIEGPSSKPHLSRAL